MKKVTLFIFVLLSPAAFGKGHIYKQYTTNDGLLSNMVYCAMEDSKGFIWLGTDGGVNRFDGKRFQQFTIDNGLSDNEVFNIREDSKGRIWFLTYNGRLSYYYNNIIYNETNDTSLKKSFYGASYYDMYEDSKGNLWFLALPNGCLKMDTRGVYTIFKQEENVLTIYEDNHGIMHLLGDSVFTLEEQGIRKSVLPYMPLTWQSCIYKQNEVLYFNGNKLIELSNNAPKVLFQSRNIIQSLVTRITRTERGRIWINTNMNGSYLLKPSDNYSSTRNYLPGKIVMSCLEDHEQNTWFCTSGEGLFLLQSNKEDVQFFTEENGLADERINSFLKIDSATFLLGCGGGMLSLLKPDTIINVRLKIPHGTGRLVRIVDLQPSDKKNIIYCASDIGVFRISISGNKIDYAAFSAFDQMKDSCLYNFPAKSCYPDKYGNCTATLSFGVYKLAPSSCLVLINRSAYPLRSYTHFYDRDNNLWTSGIDGLSKNDVPVKLDWKGAAARNRIVQIRQCDDGTIVLAMEGTGIVLLEDDKVKHVLTPSDGLASGTVRKLYINGNYIYVATNQGVSKLLYNGNSLSHLRNYNASNGLPSNDVLDVYAENGELYAATATGLSILMEEYQEKRAHPPSVYFMSVINDGEVITDWSNLRFMYNKMHLIVSYIAPSYENPEKLLYRYLVSENGKGEWTQTNNTRIEFGKLKPGDYTFLLSAKKVNSDWSAPVMLHFAVQPLFWQTTWFIWLASVALSGIVALFILQIYRRIVRRRIAALEKKEAINRERSRIASDIHDDLGSELTTIAINAEVLKHSLHAEGKMLSHLNSLSASSRAVIEKMSEIIWAVNASNDTLKNLVAYLHEFTGKYFENSNIVCHSDIPTLLPDISLSAAYRRNIFLIVKEAFHNIVRHSKATNATFTVRLIRKNQLEIIISDDGTGAIPLQNGVNRNGLMNMKKRACDLKGSLKITGEDGKGSVVSLTVLLPVHKKENFHTKV